MERERPCSRSFFNGFVSHCRELIRHESYEACLENGRRLKHLSLGSIPSSGDKARLGYWSYSHEQLVLHSGVKAVYSEIIRILQSKVGFKNEKPFSFCKIHPRLLTGTTKLFNLSSSYRAVSRAGRDVAALELRLSCHDPHCCWLLDRNNRPSGLKHQRVSLFGDFTVWRIFPTHSQASRGGCISKRGILTHTGRPCSVVPKNVPVAVLSALMT